ncbi:MAG: tetratricopeptide repeat protein [Armatimonadetes bacterium]|nr:tetratricopeptide repeat protein [Armatimonadota bacterium]
MNSDADVTVTSAVVDDRQVLQADLARVNLLRIRGDISSSKTLCLSILKRFPESVDAHVMMGDLHAEQGELAPAAEWYALALDLDRNAPGVLVKLNRVQAALDISSQANRTRSMVLAGRRVSPWLYVAVASSVIAISSIAYIAGSKSPTEAKSSTRPTISEKIVSPQTAEKTSPPRADFADNTIKTSPVNLSSNDAGPAPTDTPTISDTKTTGTKESPVSVVEDQQLLDQISPRTKYGKHIISVIADPRSGTLILTYNVTTGEHGRYIGAVLADSALEYDNRSTAVTLRGVRNGVLSYEADVKRAKILEVEAREHKPVQELENHGWIDDVLENEFFKDKELMKAPSI